LHVEIAFIKSDVGAVSGGEGDEVAGGDVALNGDDLASEGLIHDYLDQSCLFDLLEVVDLEQFEVVDEMLSGVVALHL
jgi:hypothetical protein